MCAFGPRVCDVKRKGPIAFFVLLDKRLDPLLRFFAFRSGFPALVVQTSSGHFISFPFQSGRGRARRIGPEGGAPFRPLGGTADAVAPL